MIDKIVSGGQTGVDRAALDAAIHLNINYGGWSPKGSIDEKGIIPSKYKQLVEITGEFLSDKKNYEARTTANIKDSDGTLILVPLLPIPSHIQDGTLLTIREAQDKKKPFLLICLAGANDEVLLKCIEWIKENHITTLNIAGPRETSSPGIHDLAVAFLINLLRKLHERDSLAM